jgi:hypothetical protein
MLWNGGAKESEMKTYKETIFREGCVALNQGYMGESTRPDYQRVNLIAEIYEVSSDRVRKDIERAVKSTEVQRRVRGY